MPSLIVIDRAGTEWKIAAEAGTSVMEAIREAGIDELLALCGGSASCATCHIYVEGDAGDGRGLPDMSADEDDLLDGTDHRRPGSRLSCQLPIGTATDGLRVTIAPED